MRLADFIRDNHESIVTEWVAFARMLLPEMSTPAYRDHAEELLTAIEIDMNTSQSDAEQSAKSMGLGGADRLGGAGIVHATSRIERGFKLGHLVAEYRALRASVLRLWQETEGARDLEGVTRFNEAIDEALTAATTRYMETMERYRDQFVGMLGHDLRNPLGAIAMGASSLARAPDVDASTATTASRILSSARRMERMVGDLLDLTRIRLGGGFPLQRQPMDLAPVCRQVVAEIKELHPHEPLRFSWQGDLHGEWDGDRLAQVVQNLVGNAIEHGNKESPVTIVARDAGSEVVLEVHNDGPPIPPSVVGKLFEPMNREGRGKDHGKKNLGLGLYIAEQVVSAHGGKIGVTSTEAYGTTFVVHLPRLAA